MPDAWWWIHWPADRCSRVRCAAKRARPEPGAGKGRVALGQWPSQRNYSEKRPPCDSKLKSRHLAIVSSLVLIATWFSDFVGGVWVVAGLARAVLCPEADAGRRRGWMTGAPGRP
jgi:hypothetical protein